MLDEQELEQIKELIASELDYLIKLDRYVFEKPIQIIDGRNIQTGRSNGTKIGTASDQLVGFYGTTPVDQGATVASPSGGATIDLSARESIDALILRLQDIGLIK